MDINLKFLKNEYFSIKLEDYLTQIFQTDKKIAGIVLFGSLARGDAIYSEEKRSDIDLIIIFKDNELPEDPRKKNELKLKLMQLTSAGIDSLWMTESEFKRLVQIKTDIILYALDECKILYDPTGLIKEEKEHLFKELKEKGVKKKKHYWIWPIKNFGEEIEW
jgi:predicted nucleotidyltransferase